MSLVSWHGQRKAWLLTCLSSKCESLQLYLFLAAQRQTVSKGGESLEDQLISQTHKDKSDLKLQGTAPKQDTELSFLCDLESVWPFWAVKCTAPQKVN